MAELNFYYSTMAAGKSTSALQMNYSLMQAGFKPQLLKPSMDTRDVGVVRSRIGLEYPATLISSDYISTFVDLSASHYIVDEAQFLSKRQVIDLAYHADWANKPVYCFGLRTAYTGDLFEGAAALMAIADNLIELPLVYKDGRKSIMHLRYVDGEPIFEGNPVFVGDIVEEYESVSRKRYFDLKSRYEE